jgi:tyrosinase
LDSSKDGELYEPRRRLVSDGVDECRHRWTGRLSGGARLSRGRLAPWRATCTAIALAGSLAARTAAEAQTVRVRKNIAALTPVEAASLGRGVTVMKSRPPSDPMSWSYQANIHGTDDGPPRAAWSTCQHGSFYFLSWHRMYLHFFERILRAASGDDALALPYWDYGRAEQRALPAMFRSPADASNVLFVAERAAAANAGAELPATAANDTGALVPINFFAEAPGASSFGGRRLAQPSHFSSFPGALEQQPHNVVHVLIGGPDGWMSDPNLAARDPIFWLHHANIDRLWSRWLALGGGRANPTNDAAWSNTRFTFFDENGARVEMTGGEVLDTATQLGYRYDDAAQAGPPPESMPPSRQGASPESLSVSERAIELRGRRARTTIPLGAAQHESLLESGAAERGFVLTFEGLGYDRNPGIYYEVYLGLPEGREPDPSGPHYAGNLAVFALKPHGGDTPTRPALSLDVTRTIRALRAEGSLAPSEISVTFVPRGMQPPGRPEAAPDPETTPPLRVERVRLSTY